MFIRAKRRLTEIKSINNKLVLLKKSIEKTNEELKLCMKK